MLHRKVFYPERIHLPIHYKEGCYTFLCSKKIAFGDNFLSACRESADFQWLVDIYILFYTMKIEDYSLYLVISEEYGLGRSALEIARFAISGGVDIIQLREKNKTRNELVNLASGLLKLCKEKRVMFIVNDDPLIAKECGADGVHMGQEDMQTYSITKTRKIIGSGKIIGVSTHSLPELIKANEEKNVDYIAYGPIFPTKTKNYFLGDKDMKEAVKIAKKPLVFIGGINLSNLDALLENGAKNIAAIRGILQSEDITARAASFKKRLIKEKECRANDCKNKRKK